MIKKQSHLKSLLSDREIISESENDQQTKQYYSSLPKIDGQSFFQKFFFTWLLPLLSYGSKKTVNILSMPRLPYQLTTKCQYNKIYSIWQDTEKDKRQGFTLLKVLLKAFKKEWIYIMFLILLILALEFITPFITAYNIDYIQNNQLQVQYGITLFLITLIFTSFSKIIYAQLTYRLQKIGINLFNGVGMMVYCKSLNYPTLSQKKISEAEIINYSQVDAQRMTSLGHHILGFFNGPLLILGGFGIIYWFVGISFISGVFIVSILVISCYFVSKKITIYAQEISQEISQKKDERMKITQQMLSIIRFIKITVIQKFFYKKLDKKRRTQVDSYINMGIFNVILNLTFWLTGPMLLSSIFLTYTLLGYRMTSQVAFTTMMIGSILQYPLYCFPTAISQIIQIMNSVKRIQRYLMSQQIDSGHIKSDIGKQSNYAIKIENGNFYWQKQIEDKKQSNIIKYVQQIKLKIYEQFKQHNNDIQSAGYSFPYKIYQSSQKSIENLDFCLNQQNGKYLHVLKDINLELSKGKLTMVIGDIGSGKSSLLNAIINEMHHSSKTSIFISGEIAYSAQKPWIMSGTLKQNVLFTLPYERQKFSRAIYYSCLEDDLLVLPKKQQTQIGEKGINISGGQKARISIARALYSEKQILLLDDILSAVDVHVGQFLLSKTLKGFLRGKTIVMPTHAVKFLPEADQIIIMKKGSIVKQGRYQDISQSCQFQQIALKEEQHKQNSKSLQQNQINLDKQIAIMKEAIKIQSQPFQIKQQCINDEIVQDLIVPEDQQIGKINFEIFKQYIRLNGGIAIFLILVFLTTFFWISFKTAASLIMQRWCENPVDENIYLYIYIAISIFGNIFIFIQNYTLMISAANQSIKVHKSMIKSLLYASLSNFHNRVPVGRIVNRLSKDLTDLDQTVYDNLSYMLVTGFQIFSTLSICIYASSIFAIIPMLIVGYLSIRLRRYYLKTQRQIVRFQKSTNSPVMSGFMETVSGLSTIRAYGKQNNFMNMQISFIDANKKVRLNKCALQNWFALNLSYFSLLINMPCIAFCMFSNSSNPSLIGLLMVYALTLSDDIINHIIVFTQFETQLVTLERIYKFMQIQPQLGYKQYCSNWSQEEQRCKGVIENGTLQFLNLYVRYRNDLPNVLTAITCKIFAGEKIGIVGRTGAGKSTIINSLLRLTQISQGDILVDGKSLNSYPIKDVRNSIIMIDQDPTLIKSTFRQNLDLTGEYSDEVLLNILNQCNLLEIINQKGGLQGFVSNSSLSAGEKQLLCICRAFLKRSRIVLIDEATANIDVKNDAIIQKIISQKFRESTVLTIAHRLSTLQNSNKIMVMDKGKLIEFGSPVQLQNRQNGVYSQMIRKNMEQYMA